MRVMVFSVSEGKWGCPPLFVVYSSLPAGDVLKPFVGSICFEIAHDAFHRVLTETI